MIASSPEFCKLFQSADADGNCRLTDRVFSRRENLRRSNVEGLVTRIPLIRLVVGVVELLDNGTATWKTSSGCHDG